MKRVLSGVAALSLIFVVASGTATARPVEELPRVSFTDLSASSRTSSNLAPGVLGAASGIDTVYFGGTFWNADSSRWEALKDSCWTFDSGVGSHYNHAAPGVDPFKNQSLHAAMEGWIGVDRTLKPHQFFRRMNEADFPGTGQSACAMNGANFFWCGVLPDEADALCFSGGQGYGNNWEVCIERDFTYDGNGSVTFQYEYENDTELDFDYTFVFVDTTGNGDDVELAAYNWDVAGIALHTLVPGASLRSSPGTFKLKFCVDSDQSGSDEDGIYTTNCGAFAVDDISVSGGGIAYATDFETDDGGWGVSPLNPGQGGDWSNIVHVSDLPPPLTDCVCNFSDSVLVFEDIDFVGAHNIWQNNFAASPWIDLQKAGVVGAPGKFLETDIYADLPVLNYMYAQFLTRWYPYACPGGTNISPWTLDGITHTFGGIPTCTQPGAPFRNDLSTIIDLNAEQVQIGVGIFSACAFFTNCTGLTNTSPWFDNIKFGVCGTFGGSPPTPIITAREMDLPQDAFPTDGTVSPASSGRVDSGTLRGAVEPGPFTALGDTLVVLGGTGGAEVYVQFSVAPGPEVDSGELSSFLAQVTFVESRNGLDWYMARMDTAEQGGIPTPGQWMTAFHESDPGFTGTDTDLDGTDVDPLGGTSRLANDIFPDDIFTPGTRLNLFYKTRFNGSSAWYTLPDTTRANYFEMEVLPSSMSDTKTYNCVLYVDHFDERGAQEPIEEALSAVLPSGSDNFDGTGWDRFDLRAPSSHQGTFGRPADTEYGATLEQAGLYTTIIWNTGNLSAYNLVNEDAQVLSPWLAMNGEGGKRFYLSGDGAASSITAEAGTDPDAADLLNNVLGTVLDCSTFRELDCPVGTPVDATTCVDLDPVGGAWVSVRPHGGTPQGRGNGCPANRAFDVLAKSVSPTYGVPNGDEMYSGDSKTAQYASVANRYQGGSPYRTVVDGLSLHHRKTPENCIHGDDTSEAIEERLLEVLSWFGTSGSLAQCLVPGSQIGIGDDPVGPAPVTALAPFSPNPLTSRRQGQITFTMATEGSARVDIFDLNGRLVKRVFDGTASAGVNTAMWDGADASGRQVASGVYFYSLRANGEQFSRKLVVARN